MIRTKALLPLFFLAFFLSGCLLVPARGGYLGPTERPAEIEQYYDKTAGYTDYTEETILETEAFRVRRFDITSDLGRVTVDYFERPEKTEQLIFVFPVLGGRNHFENYFAGYFAENGIDAAIVHRNGEFKDPDNYEKMEELFRSNVVRDRLAIDFFEKEIGKKRFGTFGISRGAINATVTAGIDKRLEFNVLALGGSDLVSIFKHSGEKRIKKYRKDVMKSRSMSEADFYDFLEDTIKTDPKHFAQYLDARNTLLVLSIFDDSVPLKYGMKLRRQIGYPRTIFLPSGHYTSLAYTQFVKVALPLDGFCLFPLDYIETEAVAFYRDSFELKKTGFAHVFYSLLQAPAQLVGKIVYAFWD